MSSIKALSVNLAPIYLYGHHGVSPEEQKTGGEYRLTIALHLDAFEACYTDNVADTVNYAEVFEQVRTQFQTPSHLLEQLAWRIAEALLQTNPQVTAIDLTIEKLTPPIPSFQGSASVSITATRP